jgi:hypothetical protein
VERYRYKFAAYLDLLVRYWFNYDQINAQASFHHELIAPYVIQGSGDKMFFGDTPWANYSSFENDWRWLADFARDRSEFILANVTEIP